MMFVEKEDGVSKIWNNFIITEKNRAIRKSHPYKVSTFRWYKKVKCL